MASRDTRWLDSAQQASWRALIIGMTLLTDRLDSDLQQAFDLSFTEYEILVRLSEKPERQLRMAQLADALAHSRSRVTHTVTRMEKAGLVERSHAVDDRRGIVCTMTDAGQAVLEQAAHVHVTGVRDYLVDRADPDDLEAVGRAMNAVIDNLIAAHPEMDIRT